MPQRARPSTRTGRTEKVSVSIDRAELEELRKIAKRSHGGNLSAAIMAGVRRAIEEQGRVELVAWLGDAAKMTQAEHEAIVAEWGGDSAAAVTRASPGVSAGAPRRRKRSAA